MRVARVVGTVVATQKNARLAGAKLLLVQPLGWGGRPVGSAVLAVDGAQAGVGDTVLVVVEGRAAVSALQRHNAPVDAAIVGIVDAVRWPDDDDDV